jgi:hypothetical protein
VNSRELGLSAQLVSRRDALGPKIPALTKAKAILGLANEKALYRQQTATRKRFYSEAALSPQEDIL